MFCVDDNLFDEIEEENGRRLRPQDYRTDNYRTITIKSTQDDPEREARIKEHQKRIQRELNNA